MHAVRVVCIKKGGSSMQHKAYAEMMFDPKAVPDDRVRWVVTIRNPLARLVSAYNHFAVMHRVDQEKFGPRKKFNVWLRWWMDQYPTSLDHHLKLQVFDLADTFKQWDDTHDAHLFMCPLEKVIDYADELQQYCYNRRPHVRTDIRHPHAPWWKYYQLPEVVPLLSELRLRVRADFVLWWQLVQLGGPAVVRNVNLREMFDEELLFTSELH